MSPVRVVTKLHDVRKGTSVRLEGLAEDVDGHAVLRMDRPSARVVVSGLAGWPGELHGRPVLVEGNLAYDQSLAGEEEVGLSGLIVSSATWSAVPERGATIVAGNQLIASEGTRVTIEGIAGNAHASATVAVFGDVVFIPALHSWDQALRDRAVRVEGRLVSDRYSNEPCPYQGTVTRASWGKRWSLEDATWTIVDGARP